MRSSAFFGSVVNAGGAFGLGFGCVVCRCAVSVRVRCGRPPTPTPIVVSTCAANGERLRSITSASDWLIGWVVWGWGWVGSNGAWETAPGWSVGRVPDASDDVVVFRRVAIQPGTRLVFHSFTGSSGSTTQLTAPANAHSTGTTLEVADLSLPSFARFDVANGPMSRSLARATFAGSLRVACSL